MPARRLFHMVFGGEESIPCVAFESEAAAVAAAREQGTATAPAHPVDEQRPRGRPSSYKGMLNEAVRALRTELKPRIELRERARRVLKYLAQRRTPAEMPSRDTVERYLRGKKNSRNGSKNTRRRKISAGG